MRQRGVKLAAAALALALGGPTEGTEPIDPIQPNTDIDWKKTALGKRLFSDQNLSKDGTVSCESCHNLAEGGDDGRKIAIGIEGNMGAVNTPTIFNVDLNIAQFWDGRAETLEEQIDGPIQNQAEMGSMWPEVISSLENESDYRKEFAEVYPGNGITRETIKNAIAEFMRTLRTPDSRFDQWLMGKESAIDEQEKRGYILFKSYGCASCHQGQNVGGNMFQVFGVLNEYFTRRGNITKSDLGRFNVTGNDEDRHVFKVPSLRMAAHTAPYLHDGTATTLRDAVDAMFEFQLGRKAPDEDKEAIIAFIKTLAGKTGERDQ